MSGLALDDGWLTSAPPHCVYRFRSCFSVFNMPSYTWDKIIFLSVVVYILCKVCFFFVCDQCSNSSGLSRRSGKVVLILSSPRTCCMACSDNWALWTVLGRIRYRGLSLCNTVALMDRKFMLLLSIKMNYFAYKLLQYVEMFFVCFAGFLQSTGWAL
jgi:hypothetical protein